LFAVTTIGGRSGVLGEEPEEVEAGLGGEGGGGEEEQQGDLTEEAEGAQEERAESERGCGRGRA